MVKKLFALLTMLGLMISYAGFVCADEVEKFDLIEYLESNDIQSKSEFDEVIQSNVGWAPMSMYTYSLTYVNDQNEEEVSFTYVIDYENQLVEVDTVYQNLSAASTTSGRATHDTYSSLGLVIYTVNVNGTFSRTTQRVTTSSKSGSFTPGSGSLWRSTPSVSSGNYSTTQAYARTYGTATSPVQSNSYQLTLVCDISGNLSSTFAGT